MNPYYKDERITIYNTTYEKYNEEHSDDIFTSIITDPPYIVGAGSYGKSSLTTLQKYKSSELIDISLGFDVNSILPKMRAQQKLANMFIFCSNKQITSLMNYGESNNFITTLLIWYKTVSTPFCHCVWRPNIEYIVHIRESGATFNDCNSVIKSKVFPHPAIIDNRHPTIKPLELVKNYVQISTSENDIVLDPFAGSGTTAVAALQLGRRCVCVEKEQKYCELILERIKNEANNNIDNLF